MVKIVKSNNYVVQEKDITAGVNPKEGRIEVFVNGTTDVLYVDTEQAKTIIVVLEKILEREGQI